MEENLTEEELIKIGKRHYNKIYMRNYRRKHKERLQKNSDNFYLRQGIDRVEVRSLERLEKELEELRCNKV